MSFKDSSNKASLKFDLVRNPTLPDSSRLMFPNPSTKVSAILVNTVEKFYLPNLFLQTKLIPGALSDCPPLQSFISFVLKEI